MESMALLGLLLSSVVAGYFIGYMMNIKGFNAGYDNGWRDCEKAHRYFEQSEDEEKVLKEMRTATKSHIKRTGVYKRGDMKILDNAENIGELKHAVHDICILRKEQQ